MATLQTVRDASGTIYADVGNAQLRKIPSLEEYQKGVASGMYSGTPRQLAPSAGPTAGAGNMSYVGGYEAGPAISTAQAAAGQTAFPTQSRSIATTPSGGTGIGPSGTNGKVDAFKGALDNLLKTGSISPRQQQINGLRQQQASIEGEQFNRATEFTPEQQRNLTPGQQAELRRQRVNALSGQLGNVQAAITTLKEEEAAAKDEAEKQRTYALDAMNTYLEYGVFDQLSAQDQEKLAMASGMSLPAITKINAMAKNGEAPEIREINGALYAVKWNPETGQYETSLIMGADGSIAGGGSGGSGGSGSGGSGGSGSGGGAVGEDGEEIPLEELTTKLANQQITEPEIKRLYGQDVLDVVIEEVKPLRRKNAPKTPGPTANVVKGIGSDVWKGTKVVGGKVADATGKAIDVMTDPLFLVNPGLAFGKNIASRLFGK